jgi:hypothetical protein
MLVAGCWMLDAGCWMLDVWVRDLGIGLLIPEKFYPGSSIKKKVFNNRITFSFKSD